MQDEEDSNTSESFQSEYIKILNQIIKPLARVDVKHIFHILLNNKLYEEYKRLSEVRLNKDVVTQDDLFLTQLYMKISGQPQISFMDNIEDKKIFIFSDKTEALLNQSPYEWIEKNKQYNYELLDLKEIFKLKASQKYKRNNKDISTVEIGDRYEKFCIEWLKNR
ncbi:MAG: hypothetical protein PF437_08220 [Sulfurimonas sp.]|jgi:acyl carrier protein phosphodiesterase|nr:hypothetical protein [Sulfurimonas sp.]